MQIHMATATETRRLAAGHRHAEAVKDAAVGDTEAGQHFHETGLAGAIGAGQQQDPGGFQAQCVDIQHHASGTRERQILNFEQGRETAHGHART